MKRDDGGRRSRRWLGASLVVGALAIFARVAVAAHSAAVGAAVVVVFIGLLTWLGVSTRRKAERSVSQAMGPVSVNGTLDFASLPREWQTPARETLGAISAGRAPGMFVRVYADRGWLVFVKRRVLGTGKTPFSARIRLASIVEVKVGKPGRALFGSSLTFRPTSGNDLRVDLAVGVESAEVVAQRFRDAASSAKFAEPDASSALEITAAPTPPRTPSPQAALMMMACFVPFAIAMAGAPDGPAADGATLCLTIGSVVLLMARPKWMATVLALGAGIAAAAFVIDAARTAQMLRLIGAVVSLALAAWFRKQGIALAHRQPRPSTQ